MGAWIETITATLSAATTLVAPRVGAWIETTQSFYNLLDFKLSHPVWVRGLKRRLSEKYAIARNVAPRVGAWIETHTFCGVRS